jgi:hypothetical protein
VVASFAGVFPPLVVDLDGPQRCTTSRHITPLALSASHFCSKVICAAPRHPTVPRSESEVHVMPVGYGPRSGPDMPVILLLELALGMCESRAATRLAATPGVEKMEVCARDPQEQRV